MTERNPALTAPGILTGFGPRRLFRATRRDRNRFVATTHVLGASAASPGALLIAATIAIALYIVGRRLSD